MASEFVLAPGENFVQCPYDASHQVTNAKLLMHLTKCRANYKKNLTLEGQTREMKICQFNHAHHYWSPELKLHEQTCPDRFAVYRHVAYHMSEEGQAQYANLRKQNEMSRSSEAAGPSAQSDGNGNNGWDIEEEDWEAECADNGYKAGYDPEEKLRNEVVLVVPKGMTKSERKQYRHDVRTTAAERELTGRSIELPYAGSYDIDVNLKMKRLTMDDDVQQTSKAGSSSYKPNRPPTTDDHKSIELKLDTESQIEYDSDDWEGIDPYEKE